MAQQLTGKQRAFADYYLETLNAAESARRAGYAAPHVEGAKNLAKPRIREYLEEHFKERGMSAQEVIARLTEQARADIGAFVKAVPRSATIDVRGMQNAGLIDMIDKLHVAENGVEVKFRDPTKTGDAQRFVKFVGAELYVDFDAMKQAGMTHLVKEVRQTKYGIEVKLHDAQAALGQLGRYHALFLDRVRSEDWRTMAIDDIRAGHITFEALAEAFDEDLATQLFREAGVPVQTAKGTA